jgi:hypothetical protein
MRDKRSERLTRRMFQIMPWLQPVDRPTAKACAQIEFLADQVFIQLKSHSVFNSDDEARRLLGEFRQLRQAQLSYADRLGMTPAGRISPAISSRQSTACVCGEFTRFKQMSITVRHYFAVRLLTYWAFASKAEIPQSTIEVRAKSSIMVS